MDRLSASKRVQERDENGSISTREIIDNRVYMLYVYGVSKCPNVGIWYMIYEKFHAAVKIGECSAVGRASR